MSRSLSRRGFFGALAGLGVAACDSKHPRDGALGLMERWNRGVGKALFAPDLEVSGRGDLTDDDAFPVYTALPGNAIPLLPRDWKLEVGGFVDRPMAFTLDDLMAMPRTDMRVEHHCVEGWSAIADWHGVQLAEIARRVGAHDVDYVEFRGFDLEYWSSWDRESALHPQTLVAYGMNGQPLSMKHGAPCRLYGSVKLGYKNVKYLKAINFLDHETGGYWESVGYEWYAGV